MASYGGTQFTTNHDYPTVSDTMTSTALPSAWDTWVDESATASYTVWNIWTAGPASSFTTVTAVDALNNTYKEAVWRYFNESVERRKSRRARSQGARVLPRRARKKERKALTAEQKAQRLLGTLIGEEQLKIYNETGRLLVKGEKHDYILKANGTVLRIEKDKVHDLCIHLKERSKFPATDNVIALKLLVESNEERFNEVANDHGETIMRGMPRCANG